MTTEDPDTHNEEKATPEKPGGMELILIILFLAVVAWGTYKFGIWIVEDGGKATQKMKAPFKN
ncbi:MAG: hypothetical protein VX429_03645 [Nitrospinota bacterium]|nr:hypothetical protein [Nitrospinota bacterium]